MERYVSSETLCDLAEVVLNNNILKFGKKKHQSKKKDCNWNEIYTSL